MLSTAALLLAAAQGGSIQKSHFGTAPGGKSVEKYVLTNASGAKASIITWGGILIRLQMPDRNGEHGDVVLGLDSLKPYEGQSPYFGATVGRYANRIAKGTVQDRRQDLQAGDQQRPELPARRHRGI